MTDLNKSTESNKALSELRSTINLMVEGSGRSKEHFVETLNQLQQGLQHFQIGMEKIVPSEESERIIGAFRSAVEPVQIMRQEFSRLDDAHIQEGLEQLQLSMRDFQDGWEDFMGVKGKNKPKFPYISICAVESDGNALIIVDKVKQAMKAFGIPETQIEAFAQKAMSGDYDHLLATCQEWVTITQ